jgi:DNA polymerase-3 subunit epsilon
MDAERARRATVEQWAAQQLVDPRNTLILDTETTGLMTSGYDEVVEVGVIDGNGHILFRSLCRPQSINRPSLGTEIHGITREMLQHAPSFPVVFDDLVRILRRATTILVYNPGYDRPMLTATARRYSLSLPTLPWGTCVMEQYAAWYGQRHSRRPGFTWQRLQNACFHLQVSTHPEHTTHRAVGDALATLEVIKALAARHPSSAAPAEPAEDTRNG